MLKSPFLALICAMFLSAHALAEAPYRTMSISGYGEVSRVPDAAQMSLGVVSQSKNASEALRQNSEQVAAMIKALKDMGIDKKNIATSNFSIQPNYDYSRNNDNKPPILVGYTVNNTVSVTFEKLDEMGVLLDKVVTLGANSISGPFFIVTDRETALMEARKLAMANALEKAKIYAEAGGFKLGDIITVSEQGNFHAPTPMPMRAKAMDAEMAVPIEAGTSDISMTVNVQFEIR